MYFCGPVTINEDKFNIQIFFRILYSVHNCSLLWTIFLPSKFSMYPLLKILQYSIKYILFKKTFTILKKLPNVSILWKLSFLKTL